MDRWSRVDLPPVDRAPSHQPTAICGDGAGARPTHRALLATGWTSPEVFVAKARDGMTDIWGIIVRPTNFDPDRSYPVIE